MKIKKVGAALMAFVTAFSGISALAEGVAVTVNGDTLEAEGVLVEGSVYVPLSEFANSIGATYTWDNEGAKVDFNQDSVVINTVEKVSESVVAIVGNYDDPYLSSDAQNYNDLYGHGAGVVIESNGLILTNAHVVEDIRNLTVIFGNGETYPGTVLYCDEISDLAVVQINKQNLIPITFAEENSLEVGQSVIAIGTPQSVYLINSATKGIVSGTDVNIGQHYLFTQSDVAINGGNSGGPLVNLKGELVGINSIKLSGVGVEGMSFSIDVDTINYVLDSFRKYGRVIRPETGVTLTESWESKIGVPTTKGLTVTASDNETIQAGDMITHVNGYEVHSIADYNEALKKSFNGESVIFAYTRNGVSQTVEIATEIDFTKTNNGKVEVRFTVGESTIMINGFPMEVETPYIVGEGTTLVPLRVITEAFGAEVEWINDTQEIILTYPDINIKLQIGNKTAIVNEEETTLPEAPVLSDDSVTMVPLRFISEAFGATVEFNGETSEITVVKEVSIESDTISFSTELPRIGDSYWNWSILTPTSMMMSDRSHDGTSTSFYDETGYLDIYITDYTKDEETEAEDIMKAAYNGEKSYTFSDCVLSKDEKGTDENGNYYYRLTGRSKYGYYDSYGVVRDKTLFEVMIICDNEPGQIKTYTGILESFKAEFAKDDAEKEQTFDLSNVDEDGYRPVKNEDLKISFVAPADFTTLSYGGSLNTAYYYNEDYDAITVTVYSLTETVTAESEANTNRNTLKEYFNPEKGEVSEVLPYEANELGENAVYYTLTTKELKTGDYSICDVYFEKGEYVYNISVLSHDEESDLFEKVMASFKSEELDSDEMGVIMNSTIEIEEDEVKEGNWSITLNDGWEERYAYETYARFQHAFTLGYTYFSVVEYKDTDYKSLKGAANSNYTALKKVYTEEGAFETIQAVTPVTLGDNTFYTYTVKLTGTDYNDEEYVEYETFYVMEKGRTLYMFTFTEQEEYAMAKSKTDLEKALATFTVE